MQSHYFPDTIQSCFFLEVGVIALAAAGIGISMCETDRSVFHPDARFGVLARLTSGCQYKPTAQH